MTKRTAVEPNRFHVWQCQTCDDRPEFETKSEMSSHLQSVHGIDTKTTPGSRRSTMHLDGAEYFENHFAWEIGGVHFIEASGGERDADSIMRVA